MELVIVGLGETAKLAYNYFTNDSEYEVVAFAADKQYINEEFLYDKPVYDIETMLQLFSPNRVKLFVAISFGKLNRYRTHKYEQLKAKGYSFASYISSRAFVGAEVTIGENCMIMENCVIQHFSKIGNNVYMWCGSVIGHSSTVGDNCFFSISVSIAGFCRIGKNCFFGIRSATADTISIGEDCLISMGALVRCSLKDNSYIKAKYSNEMAITAKEYFKI